MKLFLKIAAVFAMLCGVFYLIVKHISLTKTVRLDDTQSHPRYLAFFKNLEVENICQDFKGGDAVTLAASSTIDLRNSNIDSDIQLNIVTLFGTTTLFLPKNVQVVSSGVSLFAGSDIEFQSEENAPHTIHLNNISLLGTLVLE